MESESKAMNGKLWKKGKLNTSWQERFFAYDGTTKFLRYCLDSEMEKQKGSFKLAEVQDIPDRPKKKSQRIDFISQKGERYQVYAESDHEKQLWIAALAEYIQHDELQQKTSTLMVQTSDGVWKEADVEWVGGIKSLTVTATKDTKMGRGDFTADSVMPISGQGVWNAPKHRFDVFVVPAAQQQHTASEREPLSLPVGSSRQKRTGTGLMPRPGEGPEADSLADSMACLKLDQLREIFDEVKAERAQAGPEGLNEAELQALLDRVNYDTQEAGAVLALLGQDGSGCASYEALESFDWGAMTATPPAPPTSPRMSASGRRAGGGAGSSGRDGGGEGGGSSDGKHSLAALRPGSVKLKKTVNTGIEGATMGDVILIPNANKGRATGGKRSQGRFGERATAHSGWQVVGAELPAARGQDDVEVVKQRKLKDMVILHMYAASTEEKEQWLRAFHAAGLRFFSTGE